MKHERQSPHRFPYPDWSGETAFILGGGPSLRGFDAERLRPHKVVGINEAGLTMAPWCDMLFWADTRWVNWNWTRVNLHTGGLRYTSQLRRIADIPRARYVEWRSRRPGGSDEDWIPFSTDPDYISGFDAGSRAINLMYHCKVKRVVLLGFDMHDYPMESWREGNWHDTHLEPPLPNQRVERFVPAHDRMAAEITRLGLDFEVINATPGSALMCWPCKPLDELL